MSKSKAPLRYALARVGAVPPGEACAGERRWLFEADDGSSVRLNPDPREEGLWELALGGAATPAHANRLLERLAAARFEIPLGTAFEV